MEGPLVRRIEERDLALLQDIERSADTVLPFHDDPRWPGPMPGRARLGRRGFILVTGEPEAVGFAHVLDLGGDRWHLEQLSVLPDHMGHGLGRALLRAVIERTTALGGKDLTLTTFGDLAFNGPFYASEGFAEIPRGTEPERLAPALAAEERLDLNQWGRRVAMIRRLGDGEHGRS